MGNECYIKNKKKLKPLEVLELLQKGLKDKFSLDSNNEYIPEHGYMSITIKGLVFPMYFEKDKISFNDTAVQSFNRSHDQDHSYWNNFYYKNVIDSFFPVYVYLHEYMKHFLAKSNDTFLDSDGAGPYGPFDQENKYGSYEEWFKYWEMNYKKRGLFSRLILPSPKKIKKQELEYFPELKF